MSLKVLTGMKSVKAVFFMQNNYKTPNSRKRVYKATGPKSQWHLTSLSHEPIFVRKYNQYTTCAYKSALNSRWLYVLGDRVYFRWVLWNVKVNPSWASIQLRDLCGGIVTMRGPIGPLRLSMIATLQLRQLRVDSHGTCTVEGLVIWQLYGDVCVSFNRFNTSIFRMHWEEVVCQCS